MLNTKKVKQKYQEIYGRPVNKFQSASLELLKLWQEKEVSECYKHSLSSKQYIPQHRELILSIGRQIGASTLLKAIQDSYPSDIVIGVRIKRDADVHRFSKEAVFSLNLLKRAAMGAREEKKKAKKKLTELVSGKTVLMNIGKRPSCSKLTDDMIDCLYEAGIAEIMWYGQE